MEKPSWRFRVIFNENPHIQNDYLSVKFKHF